VDKRSAHRVFISYSSQDKRTAEAVCAALEAQKIKCWMAHRDNRPGVQWDEGILDALNSARAVVLILSAHANDSPMVKREAERAASKNIPIVPFRVEDVLPAKSLEFFLSGTHWLDAFSLPLEHHLESLVRTVGQILKGPAGRRGINVVPYMVSRGPAAHRDFTVRPAGPWDRTIRGSEKIEDLRAKLLHGAPQFEHPVQITVHGTLFPCALLSSGWWERRQDDKVKHLQWRDGLQQWLFHGFDLWGPSWDFTWDFDNPEASAKRPYFIAQLGDGDEANSIPVLIPAAKAKRLHELLASTWGGLEAAVTGVLGHRAHFAKYVDHRALELFGGLLDYCLWIDEDQKGHTIARQAVRTEIYSGYLWKCVAPKALLSAGTPCLNDVYFIWEHTNFADRDALAYCLESIERKEEQIRRKYGDLMLVQKSSGLVPGTPALAADTIYGMLLGKSGEVI
jgi:hypothetical protein